MEMFFFRYECLYVSYLMADVNCDADSSEAFYSNEAFSE